jgi:hypothetical protein
MFKYEDLTVEEKEFLEILGDHTKSKPLEPYTGIKSLKHIYEDYYNIRMTFEDLIKLTDGLYFHGLISYVPASISSVNNTSKSAREILEKNFSLEKSWRNQDYYIRLTVGGERTINGTDIYFQIIKENLSSQYEKLYELILETNKIKEEFSDIKTKLDSSMVKNIEILTIFIAIVAIIGGNISVFSNYQFTTLFEIVTMILITNSILLFVVMSLLIMIKKIIIEDTNGKIFEELKNIIFPVILMIIALIIIA